LLPSLADFGPIFTNNIIKILLYIDSNRLLRQLQEKNGFAIGPGHVAVFVFHNNRAAPFG
jgi:hypothetical protein